MKCLTHLNQKEECEWFPRNSKQNRKEFYMIYEENVNSRAKQDVKDFNISKLNLGEETLEESEIVKEKKISLDYIENPREGEVT
jgi:hypothetical protein